MIGIDADILEKIIKINNINITELTKKNNSLKTSINDFDYCYDGNDLDFLFDELLSQKANLNKINKIIKNYSEVLTDVVSSYKMQDSNIADIVNHSSSQNK